MAAPYSQRSSLVVAAPFAFQPLGFAQLSVGATAVGLPDIPSDAQYAWISVETESVRLRDDGGTPTSSEGVLLPTGLAPFLYSPSSLSAALFISTSDTAATLNILYYG
jgi:hypothetical protein